MEQKINVAKLLKDCPSGMELDCMMYENLYFDSLNADYYGTINCYTLINGIKTSIIFTEYGTFNNHLGAKCVIFPKGKTTWEGFHRPFNDGDVVSAIINKNLWYGIYKKEFDDVLYCYVSYSTVTKSIYQKSNVCSINSISEMHFATEEEKEKLFNAIKYNGYVWNPETKTLEKLIKPKLPKFKVGYKIKQIKTGNIYEITKIISDYYITKYLGSDIMISFNNQDEYELVPVEPNFKVGDIIKAENLFYNYKIIKITDTHYTLETIPSSIIHNVEICEDKKWKLIPNKFDISTLVPFESKVLVRDVNGDNWIGAFYSHYKSELFYVIGNVFYYQCIPYEGNEHLLGTTNDCDEFYKNW